MVKSVPSRILQSPCVDSNGFRQKATKLRRDITGKDNSRCRPNPPINELQLVDCARERVEERGRCREH